MSSIAVRHNARSPKRQKLALGVGAKHKAASRAAAHKPQQAPAFNVLVVATVSAGKSSLINALIGRELLHSANEATTACVASIEHRPNQRGFLGQCLSSTGRELASEENVSSDLLRGWNSDTQVRQIRLAGPFRSPKGVATRLVLHDTPGPNNSMDAGHEKRVLEALRKTPVQLLLYVLDIGQLTTADNASLLTKLRRRFNARPDLRIAFVLNKADLLDSENGEDLAAYVAQASAFLEAAGFVRPTIIPTMAAAALYATMALHDEPLTRAQRARLRQAMHTVHEQEQKLVSTAIVPEAVRRRVVKDLVALGPASQLSPHDDTASAADWRRLIALSGIRTVEHLIKHQRNACSKP